MEDNFTPKQIATALRVSESSVKRWCDQGVIRTDRTLGGHRRIPLQFLLEFLETTNRRLTNPEAIGLDRNKDSSSLNGEIPAEAERDVPGSLERALLASDEATCRRILSGWYATRGGIASLADNLLRPALSSIGEQWRNGRVDIYQERRSCEICSRVLHELHRILPEPQGLSPLALGGTASGDTYQIPNQLVELVFREQGWRTIALGGNIPFSSLLSAARKHMPKVFWLSISHVENEQVFLKEYEHFANSLPKGIMLVVGGRALTEELRPKLVYSAHCDSMSQLASLARTARGSVLPSTRPI